MRKILSIVQSPLVFVSAYGVLLIFYYVRFLQLALPALHMVFMAWALVLLLLFIRDGKWKLPIGGKWLLVGFVGCGILTLIINISSNAVTQAKTIVLTAISLLVIYPVFHNIDSRYKATKTQRVRMLTIATIGPVIVSFVLGVIAIVMLLLRLTFEPQRGWGDIIVGVRYASYGDHTVPLLYGLWQDPNQACIIVGASALLTWGLWLYERNAKDSQTIYSGRWGKNFLIVNTVVQLIYMGFARSRGSFSALAITLSLMLLFSFVYVIKTRKKTVQARNYRRNMASIGAYILLSVAVISLSTLSVIPYLNSVGCAPFLVEKQSRPNKQSPSISYCWFTDSGKKFQVDGKLEDEKKQSDSDITGNIRLTIWTNGIELYKHHPLLGTGVGNIKPYTYKELPKNQHTTAKAFLHNSYLDILVQYGALGLIIWLAFGIAWLLRQLRNRQELLARPVLLFSFGGVLFMCGALVFISNGMVGSTPMFFTLIILMGWLDYAATVEQKKQNTQIGDNAAPTTPSALS